MTAVRITADLSGARQAIEKIGLERLTTALRRGLGEIGEHGAAAMVMEARAAGIEQRTGQLLSNVTHWSAAGERLEVNIGVPAGTPASAYSYLLGDEVKHIRPKRGKALAIPTGANLTGAGVARYQTIAQLKAAFGDRVVFPRGKDGKQSRWVGVASKSGRGALKLMFFLSFGVTVRGKDVLGRVRSKEAAAFGDILGKYIRREIKRG